LAAVDVAVEVVACVASDELAELIVSNEFVGTP